VNGRKPIEGAADMYYRLWCQISQCIKNYLDKVTPEEIKTRINHITIIDFVTKDKKLTVVIGLVGNDGTNIAENCMLEHDLTGTDIQDLHVFYQQDDPVDRSQCVMLVRLDDGTCKTYPLHELQYGPHNQKGDRWYNGKRYYVGHWWNRFHKFAGWHMPFQRAQQNALALGLHLVDCCGLESSPHYGTKMSDCRMYLAPPPPEIYIPQTWNSLNRIAGLAPPKPSFIGFTYHGGVLYKVRADLKLVPGVQEDADTAPSMVPVISGDTLRELEYAKDTALAPWVPIGFVLNGDKANALYMVIPDGDGELCIVPFSSDVADSGSDMSPMANMPLGPVFSPTRMQIGTVCSNGDVYYSCDVKPDSERNSELDSECDSEHDSEIYPEHDSELDFAADQPPLVRTGAMRNLFDKPSRAADSDNMDTGGDLAALDNTLGMGCGGGSAGAADAAARADI
jgi:hypothetical protein